MTAEEEPEVVQAPEPEGPLQGNVSLESTLPTGGQVVGEVDLECLGPRFKRIEIGLDKETGNVAIKAIGFDNIYEMEGFIHKWCIAEVLIGNLNRQQ